MPEVSKKQFWKANPNQMALPGMEEHSHPGAVALSQGYTFSHEVTKHGDYSIEANDPHNNLAAHIAYSGSSKRFPRDLGKGEIGMIQTMSSHKRKGLATALYGLGRTMTNFKPRHSSNRSDMGESWAPTASAKYGGNVPKRRDDY